MRRITILHSANTHLFLLFAQANAFSLERPSISFPLVLASALAAPFLPSFPTTRNVRRLLPIWYARPGRRRAFYAESPTLGRTSVLGTSGVVMLPQSRAPRLRQVTRGALQGQYRVQTPSTPSVVASSTNPAAQELPARCHAYRTRRRSYYAW